MKKVFALLLAIVMLLTMAACGKTTPAPSEGDNSGKTPEQTQPVKETEAPTEEPTEAFDPSTWGVTDRCSAKGETTSENYLINFPKMGGSHAGYGVVAEQLDGTMAIISGQNKNSPAIGGVSELFPAYFDQLQFTLESVHGIMTQNFEFTLHSNQAVTVGEYEMHTFEGMIVFDNDDVHCEYPFVAYATTLKSNGAYAYWLVYDISDNQSNGDLIAEYAYNMARTFREEE